VTAVSRSILVIDDQDLALKQVVVNYPPVEKNDVLFHHVDSVAGFNQVADEHHYVVFLDFFLSKDREYGKTLISSISCDHLVCFSSKRQMSDHMAEIATKSSRIAHVHSLQKPKDRMVNEPLARVLIAIVGAT
jgi:hypothetical protein